MKSLFYWWGGHVIVALFLPLSFTSKPPKRVATVIFPFLWYNHANHLIHWSSTVYKLYWGFYNCAAKNVIHRPVGLVCESSVTSLWQDKCLKTVIAIKQIYLWILIKPSGFILYVILKLTHIYDFYELILFYENVGLWRIKNKNLDHYQWQFKKHYSRLKDKISGLNMVSV